MRASRAISANSRISCRRTTTSASPIRSAWRPWCCRASANDMSLLLEALKKAEKAKEEAQRRAQGESAAGAAPAASPGLRLQEAPAAAPAPKHVMTRAELPDISQPLEILSDDIAPKSSAKATEPRPSFGSQARPQAAARDASEQAGRATAKKVFEAKFKEPNPRLPFQLTVAALGVAVLCTVGYFWYQLRPPSSMAVVNTSPSPVAVAPAASPQAAAPAPAASPQASAPAPS